MMPADNDVHDLPEVSNTDRMHELDRACWCFPEIIEPEFDGDDTHLIHHDDRGDLMAQAERDDPTGGYHHRDGLWWYRAPRPRRLHRCTPWTTGVVDFRIVDRCACGAIRADGGSWMERNSRGRAGKGGS